MDFQSFYSTVQKDKRENGGYYPEKIRYILRTVGRGRRVLDVGCNDGYIAGLIAKNNNEVHGLDFVRENIRLAQKKGIHAKFFDISADKFPYRPDYFDVVLLGDVIEHVFDTDALLKKCYTVLKPHGCLVLTTPNVASLGRRFMLLFGISPYLEYSPHLVTNNLPSVGHIRYYTKEILYRQLKVNKFSNVEITGDKINFGIISCPPAARLFPRLSVNLLCTAYKL